MESLTESLRNILFETTVFLVLVAFVWIVWQTARFVRAHTPIVVSKTLIRMLDLAFLPVGVAVNFAKDKAHYVALVVVVWGSIDIALVLVRSAGAHLDSQLRYLGGMILSGVLIYLAFHACNLEIEDAKEQASEEISKHRQEAEKAGGILRKICDERGEIRDQACKSLCPRRNLHGDGLPKRT